jgi:hypothetical protein
VSHAELGEPLASAAALLGFREEPGESLALGREALGSRAQAQLAA